MIKLAFSEKEMTKLRKPYDMMIDHCVQF